MNETSSVYSLQIFFSYCVWTSWLSCIASHSLSYQPSVCILPILQSLPISKFATVAQSVPNKFYGAQTFQAMFQFLKVFFSLSLLRVICPKNRWFQNCAPVHTNAIITIITLHMLYVLGYKPMSFGLSICEACLV